MAEHVHDCKTSNKCAVPGCDFVFRIPPVCVSISISDGSTRIVDKTVYYEDLDGAIDALYSAITTIGKAKRSR
jgi:hypothetical protein